MHECPDCALACDCDGDDTWNDAAAGACIHFCECADPEEDATDLPSGAPVLAVDKRSEAEPSGVPDPMSEHDEQCLLFAWAALVAPKHPELRLLYAIPNAGGYRGGFKSNVVRVARAKREGVRKGVPDICLPVPRGSYHGLYVELKAKGGRVKPEQREWLHALQEKGYAAHLCVGWEDAKETIESYLKLKAA